MAKSTTQALRKVIKANNKAVKGTYFEPAQVVSINPFRIKLKDNNKLILDRSMMTVASRVLSLINDGYLSSGQKVLVCVNRGGEEIFVLDKIY